MLYHFSINAVFEDYTTSSSWQKVLKFVRLTAISIELIFDKCQSSKKTETTFIKVDTEKVIQ